MIGPEHERARPLVGGSFADAVTFSFADPDRGWFGLARLGRSGEADDPRGSALAVLFREREPVAAVARGGLEIARGADWSEISVDGLSTRVLAPLERWSITFEEGGHRCELEFEASSAPAEVPELGGMQGYEQLCRVSGIVASGEASDEIAGLGQRGRSWGAPDWERLELARSVCAWLGDEQGGIALSTVRPAGARGHDEEAVWAVLVEGGEPVRIADARISTTYDADGRQRRAGLELWVGDEDAYPHRAAGEVLCGSTLDLGQLRLDLAFMRWHSEGRSGVGRYDVLRRSPSG